MNPVKLRQFSEPLYLAGELVKVFKKIETDDQFCSLHLHNEMIGKIYDLIGKDDTEFRYKVAQLIHELAQKNVLKGSRNGK